MSCSPKGILPIVSTPFDSTGDIDMESFEHLCRRLARNGCHGLTLFGIAGEYYKLTDAEREKMAACMIPICRKHEVSSIVSVTDHATKVAVQRARHWEALGADALMLLPPFFLKPSLAQLEAHIRAVGSAVEIPVIVQYAPEQTGVGIPPEVLASIANDLPTVRDFKIECRPPGHYMSRLLEATRRPVRIHVGSAGQNMIEAFSRGAVGAMPGCSMFDIYLEIHSAMLSGDEDTAIDLHTKLLAVLNHIRQSVEMIIAFEKHILVRRGIIAHDICRKPTYAADTCDRQLFEQLYARLVGCFPPLSRK